MQFEFLGNLHGATNQFGSNYTPSGQTDTNTYALVHLIREQNGILRTLASGVRHPGARYARNELTAVGDGVAF
jgi:hypothetical protein